LKQRDRRAFMGKVFPVPLCAPCGSSFFCWPSNADVRRSRDSKMFQGQSLPLIHHGQQRLAIQIAPQILREQRVMPSPQIFNSEYRLFEIKMVSRGVPLYAITLIQRGRTALLSRSAVLPSSRTPVSECTMNCWSRTRPESMCSSYTDCRR
jgi:hypothetical protein